MGFSLWWFALFVGLTAFQDKFSTHVLGWIHRLSGAVIVAFGVGVLLSLSPIRLDVAIGF